MSLGQYLQEYIKMEGSKNVPLTEASHPFTENIDIFSPQDIVTQLHLCEQEIFSGWQKSKGILNPAILKILDELIGITCELLQKPEESLIVLSGCGTSGRLGFLTVRHFNDLWQKENPSAPPVFEYLIAGGDMAFFTSQERAEDKPYFGVEDLKEVSRGKKRVLLVGVTCGLSAPYVAGQIDYALRHPDVFTPVLLGFNPVDMARNFPIEDWDKTFYQVAKNLEEAQTQKKGFILNPLVGPEPITGSSRMKSGSATKILLDTVFTAAVQRYRGNHVDVNSIFNAYQLVQDLTYSYQDDIGKVIEKCGQALNNKGHVYYISDEVLGMYGLLDASECPPTYGADFEDVRGFIYGGFSKLNNKEGDISKKVPISVDYFLKERLPKLTPKDVVIFLVADGQPPAIDEILDSEAFTVLLNINTSGQKDTSAEISFSQAMNIDLPWKRISATLDLDLLGYMRRPLVEITGKWLLNVISTGAHVQKGKVYQNYMIDLKVSNTKLYHRALDMIQKFSSLPKEEAEKCLLKAIHQVNLLTEELRNAPVGDHIQQGTVQNKVVPTALILAITKGTIEEAQSLLEEHPITRIALSRCLDNDEYI